jgi:GntR family transcriptional regulator
VRVRNQRLASQLIHDLTTQISSGELVGEGGRLPSEGVLSERYSVSRATVREALTQLERAGIVIRRRGVGTFVSDLVREEPGLIRGWLDEAPAFADLIALSGHRASATVVSAATIAAGGVSSYLDIEPAATVLSVEKVFLADQRPVLISWTAIPLHLLRSPLTDEDYEQSTYRLLKQHGGHQVQYQRSDVRAVLADIRLSTLLQCRKGDPLLQLEETAYGASQTPLFYGLHHFRGDQVSFRQIRIPTIAIDLPARATDANEVEDQ